MLEKEFDVTKNNENKYLEEIRKELLLNLEGSTTKKIKNWKKIFSEMNSLEDLKEFYEKQKRTFTIKKSSSSGRLYFYEFIISFLKFNNQLDERSKSILFILLRNLKEIDPELAKRIENIMDSTLKKEIFKKILKNNDWEETFSNFESIEELLNYFNKARSSFPHRKSKDMIEMYYLPFIKSFLNFKEQWINTDYEEEVYKAIILLESNIFDIDSNITIDDLLVGINYSKYVNLTLTQNKAKKRWKDFFQNFENIEQVIDYYDKTKTSFHRRLKAKDIEFFKYFILLFSKFYGQNERINTSIITLIKYYKKLDKNYENFLKQTRLNMEEINYLIKPNIKTIQKKVSEKKTTQKKTSKKNNSKKIPYKKIISKENNFKKLSKTKLLSEKINSNVSKVDKNKLDLNKEFEIMLNNLRIKGKRSDGKLWYKVGLERLNKLLDSGYKFTQSELIKLIDLLKIRDLFEIYKSNKKLFNDKVLEFLVEKSLKLENIIYFDKSYFPLFKKLIKKYCKIKDCKIKDLVYILKHNPELYYYLIN